MNKTNYMMALTMCLGFMAFATTSHAGVECYFGEECAGESLCIDLQCATPSQPLTTCKTEEQCEDREVCHDDFCKPDAVVCTGEFGECEVGPYWGSCDCEGPDDWGWESSDTSAPQDGPGQWNQCLEDVAECEEYIPPDPEEVCDGPDQIEYCEDFMTIYVEFILVCEGYDFGPVNDELIAECCEALNEEQYYIEPFFECIEALEPKDCDGFELCMEILDDGDTGGNDTGYDEGDTSEDTGEQDTGTGDGAEPDGGSGSSGCSVTSTGSGNGNSLLTVLTSLFR